MPDKLTDTEIKKALECCTTNGASCKDCPAFAKVDRSNCKKYFRGALDLINRYEEKNSNLTSDLTSLQNNLTSLQAENERLNDILDKKVVEFAYNKKQEIKAEAYKECIEKAKSIVREMVDIMFDDNESKCRIGNCRYTSNVACGNEVCLTENRAFWNSKLDNLLKEMGVDGKEGET